MSLVDLGMDAPEQLGPRLHRVRRHPAMRDGARLATDVYWDGSAPLAGLAPRPVVLERSPYDVRAERPSDGWHADGRHVTPESGAQFFVDRGYVVVRQDCRGRGGSEGTFAKYVGEAADGFDTHAWLGDQPWCDGTVVTQGVSYSAHTQTAAASVGARPISAMIVDSGGFSSAWEAGGRFGGAYELKQVIWAWRRITQQAARTTPGDAPAVTEPTITEDELRGWLSAIPWRRGHTPFAAHPDFEDFILEQWSHEDLDAFWRQPGLQARDYYDRFPACPVLAISSWYDPYVFTAVDTYAWARSVDPRSCLVLGPWTHGARSRTYAGDVDFGSAATLDGNLAPDYLELKATWLEHAFGGAGRLAPVTYFLMGGGSGERRGGRLDHGGEWRTATTWPPAETAAYALHLHADGGLRVEAPTEPGEVTYEFDPREPVPSRGGGITSGEPLMSGGAFDQVAPLPGGASMLPLSARRDVVTFETEPLPAAVAIAGPVEVEVEVSTDVPDTDLTAKLVDVHPPSDDYPRGFAMNVTDGMLRLRYRDDPTHPTLLEPGRVYRVTVRLPDTANLFAPGHRIRLDISSSNFPRCDVNPNTGRRVFDDRTRRVARTTVHLGGSRVVMRRLP